MNNKYKFIKCTKLYRLHAHAFKQCDVEHVIVRTHNTPDRIRSESEEITYISRLVELFKHAIFGL